MTQYGPTSTSSASRARGCTTALGWMRPLMARQAASPAEWWLPRRPPRPPARRRRTCRCRAACGPPSPRAHPRGAGEVGDAAQHALHPDVELELVPRNHRLLEAGVVDADVVVDVL